MPHDEDMTISRLINILEELKKEHGDLLVWVADSMSGEIPLYESEVEVCDEDSDKPKRVSL